MKMNWILKAALAAAVCGMSIVSTSCDPECEPCNEQVKDNQPALLNISLSSDVTKTTDVQSSAQDNAINTIDVFVFRNGASSSDDYHRLDTYERFSGSQLGSLTLETTTGPKIVCVIVNSNISSYVGISTLSEFNAMKAELSKETLGDFTMYGQKECQMDVTTSVSIDVSRMIAKIQVNSIKTQFAGTTYEGSTLTNCKLYLVNVHGDKIMYSGLSTTSPVVYNSGALNTSDVSAMAQSGLIMDEISVSIDDSGYDTAHTLYCYANETSDIGISTKLILQADLDGVTYYYPIPVNQPEYGYIETNGHYGVRRNTFYSYGIVITSQGSMDPNQPLVHGSMNLTLSVNDWQVIPQFIKQF